MTTRPIVEKSKRVAWPGRRPVKDASPRQASLLARPPSPSPLPAYTLYTFSLLTAMSPSFAIHVSRSCTRCTLRIGADTSPSLACRSPALAPSRRRPSSTSSSPSAASASISSLLDPTAACLLASPCPLGVASQRRQARSVVLEADDVLPLAPPPCRPPSTLFLSHRISSITLTPGADNTQSAVIVFEKGASPPAACTRSSRARTGVASDTRRPGLVLGRTSPKC